jgi:hypothetical protein
MGETSGNNEMAYEISGVGESGNGENNQHQRQIRQSGGRRKSAMAMKIVCRAAVRCYQRGGVGAACVAYSRCALPSCAPHAWRGSRRMARVSLTSAHNAAAAAALSRGIIAHSASKASSAQANSARAMAWQNNARSSIISMA